MSEKKKGPKVVPVSVETKEEQPQSETQEVVAEEVEDVSEETQESLSRGIEDELAEASPPVEKTEEVFEKLYDIPFKDTTIKVPGSVAGGNFTQLALALIEHLGEDFLDVFERRLNFAKPKQLNVDTVETQIRNVLSGSTSNKPSVN